ncbi:MAG: PEP-CTERM sorting domain-containing protein [Desulfobacula sp.]|nr:PEP-CTERM sorting domain-containing protein [Desulfobacula sp.]
MNKKSVLLTVALFLLLGVGQAFSTIIDFSTVVPGHTDPLISNVQFYAGDPALLNDTWIDDSDSPGDNYLVSGYNDGTKSGPTTTSPVYETFIGIQATAGLIFGSFSFDISNIGSVPSASTISYEAFKGGVSYGVLTESVADYEHISLTIAGGFDTLFITSALKGSDADLFKIDNVDFERWQGTGPDPIPEPGTMILFGFGMLAMTALKRKK